MAASTPETIAHEATRGIDDALDWLRYPGWIPGREPNRTQTAALRRAQRAAVQAKTALEDVIRAAR